MSDSPDDSPVDAEADDASESAAPAEKSSLIAILASWLLPGLGHFYVGSTTKGIVFVLLALISWAMVFIIIGWFTTPVLVLIAAYDAYRETEAYNEALDA